MRTPKNKKRKRGRYHRGIHTSPLAGECNFRSGWEQKYMLYLDADPEVESWAYENLTIEYISNKSTGKVRKYFPDFFVRMKSGQNYVIEIKQKRKLESAVVKKKSEAAERWCASNNATYKILTEIELRQLGII
jgi:hypothetical protein